MRSVFILVIKQIGLPLRGLLLLLISRVIIDRIGLHSVLLPLFYYFCYYYYYYYCYYYYYHHHFNIDTTLEKEIIILSIYTAYIAIITLFFYFCFREDSNEFQLQTNLCGLFVIHVSSWLGWNPSPVKRQSPNRSRPCRHARTLKLKLSKPRQWQDGQNIISIYFY